LGTGHYSEHIPYMKVKKKRAITSVKKQSNPENTGPKKDAVSYLKYIVKNFLMKEVSYYACNEI